MHIFKVGIIAGLAALLAAPLRAEEPPPARPWTAPPPEAPGAAPGAPPDASVQVGAVCGLPGLRGESLPAITGDGACGVAAPVRLSSVAEVALEPPAVVSCATGRALSVWLNGAARPGFAAKGAELRALTILDAYSCRNRNGAATGKLSEHARGNAIDIGGFRLGDGTTVNLLRDWDSPEWNATLSRLRAGACGPFTTVLGPGSNALHADHFHFDVETRRSPWCE